MFIDFKKTYGGAVHMKQRMLSEKEFLEDLLDRTDGEGFIKTIKHESNKNNEDYDKEGNYLIKRFREATPKQREIMDELLIALCGWSFQTLCVMTYTDEINSDFVREQ